MHVCIAADEPIRRATQEGVTPFLGAVNARRLPFTPCQARDRRHNLRWRIKHMNLLEALQIINRPQNEPSKPFGQCGPALKDPHDC